MTVYIACHDQKRAIEVADSIGDAGFETTSRWLTQPFGPSNTFDEDTRRRYANENFDDVRRCDLLVLVAGPDRYSGGKFIEAGFAYGLGKHVVILGKHVVILGRRENVQCYGYHIPQVETDADLVALLRRTAEPLTVDAQGRKYRESAYGP